MIHPHGVAEDDAVVDGAPVVEVGNSEVLVEDGVVNLDGSVVVAAGTTVVAVGAAVVEGDAVVVVGGSGVVVTGVAEGVVVAMAGRSGLVVGTKVVGGAKVGLVTEGPPVEVVGRLPEGNPDPEPPHAASEIPAARIAAIPNW